MTNARYASRVCSQRCGLLAKQWQSVLVTRCASGQPKAGSVTPAVAEPGTEPRTQTSTGDAASDWLCAWCLSRVANEKERFSYDGKDEFTFSNPERMRFRIITFHQTHGCRDIGEPTLDHTWFPGHAWSFCQCARCGFHLGWYYAGSHNFAGLIKGHIIRAAPVWN